MITGEQVILQHSFAEALFASAIPFSTFERPEWNEFFRRLRPAFKIPGRTALSSSLLKACYEQVQHNVLQLIASAESVCLLSDGWSNLWREAIVNIMVTTPTPLFL